MKNNEIPRICEILGVKPFEKFYIDDLQGEYWFSDSGKMHFSPSPLTANDLIRLIDGESKLTKIPMWTQEDIEFAKAFSKFIIGPDEVTFTRKDNGTLLWSCDNDVTWDRLPWRLLQALKPGQYVRLSELLEEQ